MSEQIDPNQENITPPESSEESPQLAAKPKAEPVSPLGAARFLVTEIWGLIQRLFAIIWELLRMVIRLEETTDTEGTIRSITSGVELKGYNIWILVCSALLASIGLDTNSPAVIIGAMLISPLMSPILGIGLSVGINDRQLLSRSLYNFGIAVGISLLTSVLYFLITPFGIETTEMAARTKPTLLDVGVAFFGGIAGIVAGSRKDKTNAIPGVAIATALMPPMCVAGYGLANFNLSYFAGAFYLFFINSVFISLSTFLVVRFLKFPFAERMTESLRKNFLRGVVFFVVLTVVPATWIFVNLIKDLKTKSAIQAFLTDHFENKMDCTVQGNKYLTTDSLNILTVSIQSQAYFPIDSIQLYEKLLVEQYGLKPTRLVLNQSAVDPNSRDRLRQEWMSDITQANQEFESERLRREALVKENETLREELFRLRGDTLNMAGLREEIVTWVGGIDHLSMGLFQNTTVKGKQSTTQPIFTVMVTWKDSTQTATRKQSEAKIKERVKAEIPIDSVMIFSRTP